MSSKSLQTFQKCIPVFETLKDPHRQKIIVKLCEQGKMTVNEIAEQSSLSRPAVSHHLKLLRQQGLIQVQQKGTQRFYSPSLQDAINLLKELTGHLEEDVENSSSNNIEINKEDVEP
ncbi:metalloregulator ArsR/SmtB family transcription factor [Bacillus safensis]|uniref:ArsR/SmtB family transcription factor n=1 Tax=Bacillus TaxID=1386 RepID=UPI000696990F|nr:metalloregulator ArsR/SmtB family transcription factor [Bacillus safensis]MDV3450595.1 metalloregulator ArsR/SmtB family transcription factor [Bacillus safensis]MEC4588287.1 metalloregulator ArsR/SmtB family transcription factor [Bacillus safensis]MEC4628946.1 metalloregulator ArsR/SmtB family transcription factor [Bacillus safensis]MED5225189.1 metalloregulator ArsR/SmtB family transcription factor [Bacillus safensis]